MTLSQVQQERFGKNQLLLRKVLNLSSTNSFVYAEVIKLAANYGHTVFNNASLKMFCSCLDE